MSRSSGRHVGAQDTVVVRVRSAVTAAWNLMETSAQLSNSCGKEIDAAKDLLNPSLWKTSRLYDPSTNIKAKLTAATAAVGTLTAADTINTRITKLISACTVPADAYVTAMSLRAPAAAAVVAANREDNARAADAAPAQRAKDEKEKGAGWSRIDLWRLNPGESDTGPQKNPEYMGLRFKEGSDAQLRLMRACLDRPGR